MTIGACRHLGQASAATVLAMALAMVLAMALASGVTGTVRASDRATGLAATFSETGVPGGEFSADHAAPTRVPAGAGRVIGTGGIGSDDYLVLDLPPGPHTIALEFRAPEDIGYSYSAGGVVLFDTQPFAYEWAGTQLPTPIRLDHRRRQQSMTITLPESFGGRLFLALNFTHGEDIAYALSVPANVPVLTTVGTVLAGPHG